MDVPYRTRGDLKVKIKELVDPVVYARGVNYYNDGLVGSMELYPVGKLGKIGVKAKVFGTKAYSTSLSFSERGVLSDIQCSCPYEWGYCKHAVALGLKYIDEAYEQPDNVVIDESMYAQRESAIRSASAEEDHMDGKKRFEDTYGLVLSRGHCSGRLRFEITDGKANAYHYGTPYSEILRKEQGNLTESQEELLKYLESDTWDKSVDAGKVLDMAKRSSIGIYWGRKMRSNALHFNESRPEIKARLYVEKTPDYRYKSSDNIATDIVLSLEGDFGDEHTAKLFPGKEQLVLIEDNQITMYPVTPRLSGALVRMFTMLQLYYSYREGRKFKWTVRLNEEEIIDLQEVIKEAGDVFALESDFPKKLIVRKYEKAKPIIVVDFNAQGLELKVIVAMDYGFEKVDIGLTCFRSLKGGHVSFQWRDEPGRNKYRIHIGEGLIEYAPLDVKKELDLFAKLCTDNRFGFSKTLSCKRRGNRQVLSYLENNWPHVKKAGYPIAFVRDEIECATEDFKANINVDFNSENDLLGFDFECYCGEDKIGLEDLREYIESGVAFLKTGDGKLLKVGNKGELEKFIHMLESFHQKESQRFEGRVYHAPELDNMIAESKYYNTKVSESFRDFMSEVQSGKPVEKVKIPTKIGAVLRHYQKEGIYWFYFLRKYRFGGVLADDMGLGKTLQALLLVQMNREVGKPSIVVCPKTLLFNWQDEAVKFFPQLKAMIVEGAPGEREKKIAQAKEYDLVVTSFSALKKDADVYEKMKMRFNYCIVDEAQFIKNHKTQSAKAVKKIDADYRLAMTGTPLENSVSEVWSIFDFVMPGFLGNYNTFKTRFENPIMKQSDGEILAALRGKISCFMLRRSKAAVLKELPPKIEQLAHCQLGDHQNILYQEILANTKKEIFDTVKEKGFAKSQIHILAALMKLRQVCNHPALLLKDANHKKYESAKLDLFMELIDEIMASNRKVLVFSQFTSMLDILAKEMKAKKIRHNYLSGKTQNRKELVDDFNTDPDKKVFLISLKAGGTGLNLVSADNVIIFDPWWNPSVENQAIDRAHRIGQKNSVNVYKLVTKGTIEEKILKLQEKKKFLFDNLVDESNDLFKKLTWDDVRELFD